jgi:methyl-accepting chemotaxis protein
MQALWSRVRTTFDNASLLGKLLMLAAGVLLPLLAVSLGLLLGVVGNQVERSSGARVRQAAFSAANILNRNLSERYSDVLSFSTSRFARNMDAEEQNAWMNTLIQNQSPIYRLMLVADTRGNVIATSSVNAAGQVLDTSKVIGSSVAQEPWFVACRTGAVPERTAFTSPAGTSTLLQQLEPQTDPQSIGFSAPIRGFGGQIIGVWHTLLNWAEIEKILSDAQTEAKNNGYPSIRYLIADANGALLSAPNKELVGKTNLKDSPAYRAAQTQQAGFRQDRDFGDPALSSRAVGVVGWFASDQNTNFKGLNWTILASQAQGEIAQEQTAILGSLLLVLLLLLFGALLVSGLMSRYVVRQISSLKDHAVALSQGNLGREIVADSRDEIGTLRQSFKTMTEYQRQMAHVASAIAKGDLSASVQPKSEHDELGNAFVQMSQRLREVLRQIHHSSQAVSSASQQILAACVQQSSGVSEQSAAVAQTSSTVSEVSQSSSHALELTQAITSTASRVSKVADVGIEAARTADDGMQQIRGRVSEIAEQILGLSQQTQSIGEIIASVSDIADQSNLLALNAAIEASRAGEHGRGFAVVAQEIRNLSEKSKTATEQIKNLLGEIQRATNSAVMTSEQGLKVAEHGAGHLAHALQTIEALGTAIRESAEQTQMIQITVQQNNIGMNQIEKAIGSISDTTQSSLYATQQTQSIAQQLEGLANKLREVSADFKT